MAVIIRHQNARVFATKMAIRMNTMERWQAKNLIRTEVKPIENGH